MRTTSRTARSVFGGTSRRFRSERRADVDQLIVEVDVSPVEAQEFPLAESTEDGCGEERSVAGWRRFEEASDLLGVEDRSFLPRDAWPFAAVELADRVGLDQAAAHCVREQP